MTGLPIWLVPGEGKKFVRSRLVPMPTQAPPCFASQKEWNTYKFICDWQANQSGSGAGSKRMIPKSFTYCVDCTPEYRDEMKRQGRCRFPGTVFSKKDGVVEGRRA